MGASDAHAADAHAADANAPEAGRADSATEAGGVPPGAADSGAETGGAEPDDGSILPCPALDPKAGWQQITPPGDLGDSIVVQLHPHSPGTVYVNMHKGGNGNHSPTDGFYVSQDCGTTWSRIPQGRNSSDPGTNIYSGSLQGLNIDPTNPNVMYTVSNYGPGGVWKSLNGGIDWDQIVPDDVTQYLGNPNIPGPWFNALTMDPTNPQHLVGATHTGCMGPYAPNCLAETTDGGNTWKLVLAPDAGGNEANGMVILDATTMLYGTPQGGLFLTKDGGSSWSKVASGVSGAFAGFGAYRALDGTYYLSSDYGVLHSPDFSSWALVPGSGMARALVGTGSQIIVSRYFSFTYSSAPESDASTWTDMSTNGGPATADNGGVYLRYDEAHRVLYSSNYDVGLWRLVLP
jgi:photosystem II stability/assembly factor-like uncharacterized protein